MLSFHTGSPTAQPVGHTALPPFPPHSSSCFPSSFPPHPRQAFLFSLPSTRGRGWGGWDPSKGAEAPPRPCSQQLWPFPPHTSFLTILREDKRESQTNFRCWGDVSQDAFGGGMGKTQKRASLLSTLSTSLHEPPRLPHQAVPQPWARMPAWGPSWAGRS